MTIGDPHADRRLIEGVQAGDAAACEQFDQRFRPRMLGVLRRRGIGPHDAEDIVQDALAAALAQLRDGRFQGRSTLGSWVWSIVMNRLRDHLRADIRRERRSVALDGLRQGVEALRVGDDEDLRLAVRDAMQSLPPRERLVLLLNVQGGRRSREIAPLLKLGVKVTEALLTRAKRRFRESLRQAQETAVPGRLKE